MYENLYWSEPEHIGTNSRKKKRRNLIKIDRSGNGGRTLISRAEEVKIVFGRELSKYQKMKE